MVQSNGYAAEIMLEYLRRRVSKYGFCLSRHFSEIPELNYEYEFSNSSLRKIVREVVDKEWERKYRGKTGKIIVSKDLIRKMRDRGKTWRRREEKINSMIGSNSKIYYSDYNKVVGIFSDIEKLEHALNLENI